MNREKVDFEGLSDPATKELRAVEPPPGLPFRIGKIGHVVLMVRDIDVSVRFYARVLGLKVSDAYPDSMAKGRMVFMRFGRDHHGVALVGQGEEESRHRELHHLAFEVATIDEVFRAREHLREHGVEVDFEGRRRAGCQVAVEFRDPDGHCLEIFWGLDQVDWSGEARPPEEWVPRTSLEAAVDDAPPGQDAALADPGLRRPPAADAR